MSDHEATKPVAYRIPTVAQLTGLSERYLYELAQNGRLPCVRVGRSVLVRRDDLDQFLADHLAVAPSDGAGAGGAL